MSIKWDREQQNFIADKLMDSANYALAGLVFGQLLTESKKPILLIIGIIIYIVGWIVTVTLKKGGKK